MQVLVPDTMIERPARLPLPPGPPDTPLGQAAAGSFLLMVASLPWSIAPMSIAAGLCAALTLPLWVRRPGLVAQRTPVDLPALGWLAALVLSAAFALDRTASLARVSKGLMPALVLLAAFHARDPRRGRRALAVLLVSAGLGATFGLGAFAAHGASHAARARGAVGHYMTFAGQLLLLAGTAAGVAVLAREPRWRAGAAAGAALGAAALAVTFTRSAWIGLAVALAVLLGAVRPRRLPALAAVIALALVAAPAPYRARALSAFDPRHPVNLERTYMWQAGLRMFGDHPLTGVGLQDLKTVYDRYRPPQAHERAGHLHSVPIQVAASMGIVGLMAFAWLVFGLFRATTRDLAPALRAGGLAAGLRLGVTAAFSGFLVAGLFEWNFGDEELLYLLFTLVGLAWAARGWEAPAVSAPGEGTAGLAAAAPEHAP